jgi:methylthioribose-1-phosphate isomerase
MARGEDIEIENRDDSEVSHVEGWDEATQTPVSFRILPQGSRAFNPGFDVTPARLVSGLITEKGICQATEEGIGSLFGH